MGSTAYYLLVKKHSTSDNEVTDEALLSSIAVGDDDALLAFVRRYQRRIFGLALTIVRDPGAAEDIAQEALIRILRHAPVFDPRRGSVTSWALTITRNLAIDSLRIRRMIPTAPNDHVFMSLTSARRSPDDVAELSDDAARVREVLRTLPLEQRRAVVLATIYGKTIAEIAVEEDIPLGTAKGRVRLGLAKLREAYVSSESS